MKEENKSITQNKEILNAVYGTMKNTKLYGENHPSAQLAITKFFDILSVSLNRQSEVRIDYIDGLLSVDENLFFDESLRMYDFVRILELINAASLTFVKGVLPSELKGLFSYLIGINPHLPPNLEAPHYSSSCVQFSKPGAEEKTTLSGRSRNVANLKEKLKNWHTDTETLFNNIMTEQNFSLSDLTEKLETLLDDLDRAPSNFSAILFEPTNSNPLVHHAVRTMVMTAYIGMKLGYESNHLKTLAMAGLFHDIGRHINPIDLATPHQLDMTDKEAIKLHTRDGASFLAGVLGIPLLVIRAAYEHHIGYDKSGYPTETEPHLFSQIVGLADYVSWQTRTDNFVRRPVPLHRLVRLILKRSGTQFDPILVKTLLPFLGLYPAGTLLSLDDAVSAMVVEPNTRNVSRPSVMAVSQNDRVDFHWLGHVSSTPNKPFEHSVTKTLGTRQGKLAA